MLQRRRRRRGGGEGCHSDERCSTERVVDWPHADSRRLFAVLRLYRKYTCIVCETIAANVGDNGTARLLSILFFFVFRIELVGFGILSVDLFSARYED